MKQGLLWVRDMNCIFKSMSGLAYFEGSAYLQLKWQIDRACETWMSGLGL